MSVLISVEELRKACLAAVKKKAQRERIQDILGAPGFFIQFNQHGFYKGYDSKAGQACFLLEVQAARKIISSISNELNVDLQLAGEAVSAAAHRHRGEHFKDEEEVDVSSVAAYQAIIKSFKNLVKQQKSQALHAEVSQKLVEATELAQPKELHSTAKRGKHSNLAANRMFLSIDFEWWEKSDGVILEIGWSLWDTFTCKHRSRHWVIKENLNKSNGRHISDNRNFFLFGSSERGSLDKAFDALQTEVDQLGLTEGLTYQQIQALKASGIELVLVGHGMTQDLEQAQLFEVEWPEDMKMFDTQKLYMAWQLQWLGASAGRKALEEVVLRAESAGAAPKSAPTLEMPSMLVGQQRKTAIQPLVQAAGDDDSETEDFHGVPVASDSDEDIDEELEQDAVAAVAEKLQGMSAGSGQRAGSAGSNGKHKGRPKGPTQVQNPPRTRPWPAGPAPAGNDCPTGLAPGAAAAWRECTGTDQEIKLDRQIGLAPLLAAMGIKASRMHNAGNDARFTMEAFLALAGHEPCPDPAEAHMQAAQHDDRYQQQLESSLQAARAQGWGSPLTSTPGPSPQSQARPNSGGHRGRHGSNLSPAGTGNMPGNGAAAAGGRGKGMFAEKSGGASPAVQAAMLEVGPTAASPAGRSAAVAGEAPSTAAGRHHPDSHSAAWGRALADVMGGAPPPTAPPPEAKPAAGGWAAVAARGAAQQQGQPVRHTAAGAAAVKARPSHAQHGVKAVAYAGSSGGSSSSYSPPPGQQQLPPQKQQGWGGPAAFNSSVGTAAPVAQYQPNEDGW